MIHTWINVFQTFIPHYQTWSEFYFPVKETFSHLFLPRNSLDKVGTNSALKMQAI